MHARIRKMLDFLGWLLGRRLHSKNRPRSFRKYLELVNVTATEGSVKYLFGNYALDKPTIFPL
jgi:hypothetical protein